jgi:hypothetical protein
MSFEAVEQVIIRGLVRDLLATAKVLDRPRASCYAKNTSQSRGAFD